VADLLWFGQKYAFINPRLSSEILSFFHVISTTWNGAPKLNSALPKNNNRQQRPYPDQTNDIQLQRMARQTNPVFPARPEWFGRL
jgi:hypothetical protein